MCTSAICYYFYVASETILDCELNSKIIAFQPLAYYIPPLSPPSGALLFLQNTSFFMSADDPLALVLCIFFLHRSNLFVSLVSSACRVARPHQMTVDVGEVEGMEMGASDPYWTNGHQQRLHHLILRILISHSWETAAARVHIGSVTYSSPPEPFVDTARPIRPVVFPLQSLHVEYESPDIFQHHVIDEVKGH